MSSTPLRIYYEAQEFRSHLRAANDYLRILDELGALTPNLAEADVAVLHFEPQMFRPMIVGDWELQQKYLIGCTVWEAEDLPKEHQLGLACLDEVWTPSEYCRQAFAAHHPRVLRIPHVCERSLAFRAEDRAAVEAKIKYDPGCFYYLTICMELEDRKNAPLVMRAFDYIRARVPQARLVVKASPGADNLRLRRGLNWETMGDVVVLKEDLSAPQLNALYDLAQVFVSAHHAEGWGLAISDAMLFGRLVVVTAYSGNMDFTNEENALLVSCDSAKIRKTDQWRYYTQTLTWGEPHQESLESQMLTAYQMCQDGSHRPLIDAGKKTLTKYSRDEVKRIVRDRIDAIARDWPDLVRQRRWSRP